MLKWITSIGGLLISLCSFAETADSDWKLVTNKNDVQVYMMHNDASRLKTFRGTTILTDVKDYNSVSAIFNDYESMPRWLHFVSKAEEVARETPLKRQMRFTTHLPWPVANREALLDVTLVQDSEYSFHINLDNRPDLLPRNKDYIRFPYFDGRFDYDIIAPNTIQVTYELILDPGGYIPSWLVNMLLKDAPYFTLSRLRRLYNQERYQGQRFDYISFPPNNAPLPAPQNL